MPSCAQNYFWGLLLRTIFSLIRFEDIQFCECQCLLKEDANVAWNYSEVQTNKIYKLQRKSIKISGV